MRETPLRQPELPLWGSDASPLPAGDVRRLRIGDRLVPYVLRRGRRRTIGLSIDAAGLRVGAPARAALSEVEAVILRHGDWVLSKLQAWAARAPRPLLALVDGASLPVLGRSVVLRLVAGSSPASWQGEVLTLAVPAGAAPAAALERALRAHALAYFGARLRHYAALLGVEPPPLALSSARTRWGSCSLRTGIRINWRLVFCAPALVDYVLAHELAHLREMNHSPRFWHHVAAIFPAWQAARRELREVADRLPRFA